MGLRVNTNISSMTAQRNLGSVTNRLQGNYARLASGLRIATALVVIGVLGTEILASLGGIGYLISYHQTLYDTGHIYLGILLALTLVFIVNYGITRLERRLSWKS